VKKIKYLIVDGSNIFYRYFHGVKNENYLQYLIKYIHDWIVKFDIDHCFIFLDNNYSKIKTIKEIDPSYKANRKAATSSFIKQIGMFQSFLLSYNDNVKSN
jgi:5'-3' exonuclease